MVKNVKRPSLFKDEKTTSSRMKSLGDKLVESTLTSGMSAIRKSQPDNIKAVRKPKYLEITEKRLEKLGVIDLKPYFAASPNRKQSKDGGWYLTVPIKRKSRDMSRRMYDQLRAIDISPEERKTVISDYLYDRRRVSEASMLNYEPKSKRIEKRKVGRVRHTYTAYRTVSSKSPANSWIVNRDRVNAKDQSKTFVNNVNRLMKWKMRNGWN